MKIIRIFLLFIIFFIPVAGIITTPCDLVLKGENRNITAFPEFGKTLFFTNLKNYVTDRIFYKVKFEEEFFHLYKKYFTFFKFDKSEISIEGREGWLFFSDSLSSNSYRQHSFLLDKIVYNKLLFNRKLPYLKEISSFSKGKFFYVVGPDKHGIYPEFMDQHYGKPGHYRLFSDFMSEFESNGFVVIDPFEAIRAYKSNLIKQSLYYTDDTHWNLAGAKVAFDYLMPKIVNDYKPYDYVLTFFKHKKGDLVRNIVQPKNDFLDDVQTTRENLPVIQIYDINSDKLIYDSKLKFDLPDFGTVVVNDSARDDRTVLLLSDSFGHALKGYLSDYFNKVVHCYGFNQDPKKIEQIIKKYNPDIVLFVNVERNFAF